PDVAQSIIAGGSRSKSTLSVPERTKSGREGNVLSSRRIGTVLIQGLSIIPPCRCRTDVGIQITYDGDIMGKKKAMDNSPLPAAGATLNPPTSGPPTVIIIQPADGQIVGNPLSVFGTVDPASVTTVTIEVFDMDGN